MSTPSSSSGQVVETSSTSKVTVRSHFERLPDELKLSIWELALLTAWNADPEAGTPTIDRNLDFDTTYRNLRHTCAQPYHHLPDFLLKSCHSKIKTIDEVSIKHLFDGTYLQARDEPKGERRSLAAELRRDRVLFGADEAKAAELWEEIDENEQTVTDVKNATHLSVSLSRSREYVKDLVDLINLTCEFDHDDGGIFGKARIIFLHSNERDVSDDITSEHEDAHANLLALAFAQRIEDAIESRPTQIILTNTNMALFSRRYLTPKHGGSGFLLTSSRPEMADTSQNVHNESEDGGCGQAGETWDEEIRDAIRKIWRHSS